MRYRFLYHVLDATSDDDSEFSSHRYFYAKNDEAAKRKVWRIKKYELEVGMGIVTPLKLLRIIQRETKKKREESVEVSL